MRLLCFIFFTPFCFHPLFSMPFCGTSKLLNIAPGIFFVQFHPFSLSVVFFKINHPVPLHNTILPRKTHSEEDGIPTGSGLHFFDHLWRGFFFECASPHSGHPPSSSWMVGATLLWRLKVWCFWVLLVLVNQKEMRVATPMPHAHVQTATFPPNAKQNFPA